MFSPFFNRKVTPLTPTTITNGGCNYGKGTRWGIGITVMVLLTIIGILAAISADIAHKAAANNAALTQKVSKNTELIYSNGSTVGRIDERLKSISATQERILVILEK